MKNELEHRLKKSVKQRLKDRINNRMTKRIKYFQSKNKTLNKHSTKSQNKYTRKLNKLTNQKLNNHNHTNFKSYTECSIYDTNIKEIEEIKNSSDYEAMWETAIDKWTRNWNFYREQITDSIIPKFKLNNKRQKRQTNIDLTGQNINGSATGPQDIFIEHYDCDVDEISNVKH